jgi:hypothetical protein
MSSALTKRGSSRPRERLAPAARVREPNLLTDHEASRERFATSRRQPHENPPQQSQHDGRLSLLPILTGWDG